MAEKGLKWRDIFLALLGTILSFADPITDILTLVEFYRADHKKWFTVGLVFIIFPCSLYFLVHCTLNLYKNSSSIKLILTRAFLFGFHPFCPALVKLKMLISDLKKLWSGGTMKSNILIMKPGARKKTMFTYDVTTVDIFFCSRPLLISSLSLLSSYKSWLFIRNR